MGDVWGVQMYRGFTDVGVYTCMGDVQKYEEHTDIWGCTDGGHTDTPKHTDSHIYPNMPVNYTWVLYFL